MRDAGLARRYMEYKDVPAPVIARVIDSPALRRKQSITPSTPDEQ